MFIQANDTNLFYTKSGSGPALLLLHGNGEDHTIFDTLTAQLQNHFTVYALDTRGHGQSQPVPEYHYADMTEDAAAFINQLQLAPLTVIGFSDGGIIALLLAMQHPGLVKGIVACGANYNPRGLKARYRFLFGFLYLFNRDAKIKMMFNEPDITLQQLKNIAAPTLFLAGQRDMIAAKHTHTLAGAVPGSQLIFLKGETHSSYVVNSPKLYKEIFAFLNQLYPGFFT